MWKSNCRALANEARTTCGQQQVQCWLRLRNMEKIALNGPVPPLPPLTDLPLAHRLQLEQRTTLKHRDDRLLGSEVPGLLTALEGGAESETPRATKRMVNATLQRWLTADNALRLQRQDHHWCAKHAPQRCTGWYAIQARSSRTTRTRAHEHARGTQLPETRIVSTKVSKWTLFWGRFETDLPTQQLRLFSPPSTPNQLNKETGRQSFKDVRPNQVAFFEFSTEPGVL